MKGFRPLVRPVQAPVSNSPVGVLTKIEPETFSTEPVGAPGPVEVHTSQGGSAPGEAQQPAKKPGFLLPLRKPLHPILCM
jgi:hypothetical protein